MHYKNQGINDYYGVKERFVIFA